MGNIGKKKLVAPLLIVCVVVASIGGVAFAVNNASVENGGNEQDYDVTIIGLYDENGDIVKSSVFNNAVLKCTAQMDQSGVISLSFSSESYKMSNDHTYLMVSGDEDTDYTSAMTSSVTVSLRGNFKAAVIDHYEVTLTPAKETGFETLQGNMPVTVDNTSTPVQLDNFHAMTPYNVTIKLYVNSESISGESDVKELLNVSDISVLFSTTDPVSA